MSDPSVDLEKGITGLKEQEEEEDFQFKHLKVKHMIPVVYLAATIVAVVLMHRKYPMWYSWLMALILSPGAILLFWKFREIKEENIQRMLGSADSDISTTLLASTPKASEK